MGFAAGFQAGSSAVERGIKMREEDALKQSLAREAGRYGVTEGAYGPGLQENIQQLQSLREQDPTQAPAYDQAIAELTRRQGLTAPDFSVASGPTNFATRQEARQAAAPLRTEGLAGVYRQYGDIAKADELEARAFDQQRAIAREARDVKSFETTQKAAEQQGLLTGAQLTDIQRKQNLQAALDLRLADINSQTFEKPEMRTQAVLSLVEELQGPQAAAQLRASYSQNELNDIALQAKKFEEGYRQSRAKGVTSALEWFDEQNTSFKLERDPKNPFRYIQVNQDGTRSVFADAKSERELGMMLDAKAKPGGWLELSKYELDVKKAGDLAKYYSNIGTTRGVTSLKQQVADFKEVFGRDPSDEEKGIMAKLINKESNKPEFNPKDYAATVKSFTDAGFSPTDALIRADQLYGRGPAAGKEDVDLQAADKAKGGKTNAPAEKVGLTTQPVDKAAPAPAAQPPRPPNTVEAIQAANLQKLVPLASEFKAAEQQYLAAARSGDQKAIAQYMQKKEVLRQQLESQLEKQFGNTAPAAYKQLLSLGS